MAVDKAEKAVLLRSVFASWIDDDAFVGFVKQNVSVHPKRVKDEGVYLKHVDLSISCGKGKDNSVSLQVKLS